MVVAALIPVAFFALLELGLRAADYGPNLSLFVESAVDTDYLLVNGGLGRRYFLLSELAPMVSDDAFLKEKPDDVFRIFALGASSAGGYPYQNNGSFSSILRAILSEQYPDTRIEMINLAMPAVPSYAVRDMALGLGQYEPDLFLIYAGHNEFYGALGVGSSESIGTSRTLVRLILWLNHFRTFQLVADAVRGVRARLPGPAEADPDGPVELMEQLPGERAIAHGSPLFHLAGDVFEANLQDVIDFARLHDAPVLIGTLVSNLRDQAPFVDVHRHPERKQAWQARLREAEAFWAGGDRGAALTAIDATIALDPLPASQYFLKGRILAAAGRVAGGVRRVSPGEGDGRLAFPRQRGHQSAHRTAGRGRGCRARAGQGRVRSAVGGAHSRGLAVLGTPASQPGRLWPDREDLRARDRRSGHPGESGGGVRP